ncbi:hypothetical protein MVEN_01835600 [Mycena venus]|uniref:Secreted protein n=1 Tax=Mycena venus TaxID=2733690 RepID=A0A8H7CP74_9AGAR|nr:hypothetical protein MVEN_01835600 [Mycena venus]
MHSHLISVPATAALALALFHDHEGHDGDVRCVYRPSFPASTMIHPFIADVLIPGQRFLSPQPVQRTPSLPIASTRALSSPSVASSPERRIQLPCNYSGDSAPPICSLCDIAVPHPAYCASSAPCAHT